jgi:hypothetical protein
MTGPVSSLVPLSNREEVYWIEETTEVEVHMYIMEKDEEETTIINEHEETERVEDVIIISDEVGIAHYIFNTKKIALLHTFL